MQTAPTLTPTAGHAPVQALFVPRTYQYRGLSAIVCAGLNKPWLGGKPAPRMIQLRWPRQHGKDRGVLNAVAQVARQRQITIWYCFPEYQHARTSFWENIDAMEDGGTGRRILDDVLPWAGEDKQQMTLTFEETGSVLRMIGSDHYNRVVGGQPYIVVFSEWARCDPRARAFIQPMIDRNNGVMVFITTAFGGPNNHSAVMARTFPQLQGCYSETLTVEQCYQDAPGQSGARVISDAVLERHRQEWRLSMGRSGMSDEMIRQEYYNDDSGVSEQTIFGGALMKAEAEGRVLASLPVERAVPVDTYWDLGRSDATAVWFVQAVGPWFHVVDYLEATSSDIAWWAGALGEKARERGYVYRRTQWPHDGKQKHWGPSETREQAGRALLSPAPIIPEAATPLEDQINAGRAMFSRAKIDGTRCQVGIEALRSWHKPYDHKNRVFGVTPVHDWSSHASSAWCTFALYAAGAGAGRRVAKMAHEL